MVLILGTAMLAGCLFPSFDGMVSASSGPEDGEQDAEAPPSSEPPAPDSGGETSGRADGGPTSGREVCNGRDDNGDGTIDEIGCEVPVVAFRGHAYMFVGQRRTWESARAFCAAAGYHLVTIDSAEENAFLRARLRENGGDTWWIGFNDRAEEGVFVWDDGSPVTFTKWSVGEPDDFFDGEDCVELNSFSDPAVFQDASCEDELRFVCEAGP